jgi:hypothetical protein
VSAFLAAAEALSADPNLGVDATVDGVACRGVLTRPEDLFARGFGGPPSQGVATILTVAASALATRPARGDAVSISGTAYTVAEALADESAASWTLHLRKA